MGELAKHLDALPEEQRLVTLLDLAEYLVSCGREDALRDLLLDFDWLQAKLEAAGPEKLIEDFQRLENPGELALVRDALRLSGHVLADDPTQLAGQLIGRICESVNDLAQDTAVAVARLLVDARGYAGAPWLCPLTQSLQSPQSGLVYVLTGHDGGVNGVVVANNPDDTLAVSASEDGALRVWDLKTGTCVRRLEGHTACVNAVAVTADGTLAVSGSDDRTVKLWHIKSGCAIKTLKGHTGAVNAVAVTPDGRYAVSGSEDETLKLWDLAGDAPPRVLEGPGRVNALALSPDGRYLVSALEYGAVEVWDLAGDFSTCLQVMEKEKYWDVTTVALSPDGRYVVWVGGERLPYSEVVETELKIWDRAGDAPSRTLQVGCATVTAVALSADGRCVVSSELDGTLKKWNLADDEPPRVLEGPGRVNALALSPDGRYLVSALEYGVLEVWDLAGDGSPRVLKRHDASAVAISPDGRYVVLIQVDGALKKWVLAGHGPARELDADAENFLLYSHSRSCVYLSPDGRHAILATPDDRPNPAPRETWLEVRDLAGDATLYTLFGHRGDVCSAALSSDGRYAVSGTKNGTLNLWGLANYRLCLCWSNGLGVRRRLVPSEFHWPRTLEGHRGPVTAVALSPDGRFAISGSVDETLKVWDLDHKACGYKRKGWGETKRKADTHTGSLVRVLLTTLAALLRTLVQFFVGWHTPARTLLGHTAAINTVALSADSRYLVSGSNDRTVRVWDLAGDGMPRVLQGHSGAVNVVALSAKGGFVVSGSLDRTLKVCDFDTGRLVATFTTNGPVHCCAVASDGRTLVASDRFGTVHFLRPMAFPKPTHGPA